MPSPVPRMKDDLNCSAFSFLSYKSFNKIFSGPVHTSRIRKFFKTKIFFEKKTKRALAAYSSSFRLLRRKRLNNGKTIRTCPYYTGPALYDVWHHRIRKSPFFVCPHESDKPAFPKVFLIIIIDIKQWQKDEKRHEQPAVWNLDIKNFIVIFISVGWDVVPSLKQWKFKNCNSV